MSSSEMSPSRAFLTAAESDDDVGLHALGCRLDILGTNCRKQSLLPNLPLIPTWPGGEGEKERKQETRRKQTDRQT